MKPGITGKDNARVRFVIVPEKRLNSKCASHQTPHFKDCYACYTVCMLMVVLEALCVRCSSI